MSSAASARPERQPDGLRRVATRALTPLTVIVPVTPLLASLSLGERGVAEDDVARLGSLTTQMVVLGVVLLLAMLLLRGLLRLQWARIADGSRDRAIQGWRDVDGPRLLTRAQSWWTLLLAASVAWFSFGVATIGITAVPWTGHALVHGMFGLTAALIALCTLALRRSPPAKPRS